MKLLRCLLALLLIVAGCFAPAAAAESPAPGKPSREELARLAEAGRWREVLDLGARLLVQQRAAPTGSGDESLAETESLLGDARQHLNAPALAETHFRRALALQEKALREDASEIPATLTRLASALKDQQRYEEAAPLLRRALELERKEAGEDDEVVAVGCRNLAWIYRLEGSYAQASALFSEALGILRKAAGPADAKTLLALLELAEVHELRGDFAAAEACALERVAALQERFGEALEVAGPLIEAGATAERLGHFADAEARFRRALDIRESLLPADDPTLAEALTRHGWSLHELGRESEAAPQLERALEIRSRTVGLDHMETAASLRNLALVWEAQHQLAEARPLLTKALQIRKHHLGASAAPVLESLGDLAALEAAQEHLVEAAQLYEECARRIEQQLGPKSSETAAGWHHAASAWSNARRWPEAQRCAMRAFQLCEQRAGATAAETLAERVSLARIFSQGGDFVTAASHYEWLASWFAQHPSSDPALRAEIQRELAVTGFRAGQTKPAEARFIESRRLHSELLGAAHPATLRSIGDLWTYYEQTGQPGRALAIAEELAAQTERAGGASAPATLLVFEKVAQLCVSQGNFKDAARWFRRALDGRRRSAKPGSAELCAGLLQIATWLEDAGAFREAAEFRRERLSEIEYGFGAGSEEAASACGEAAATLYAAQDYPATTELLYRQLTLTESRSGANARGTIPIIERLGDAAAASGDARRSVEWRERLVAAWASQKPREPLEDARALLLLGEALLPFDYDARAGEVLLAAQTASSKLGVAAAPIALQAASIRGIWMLRHGGPHLKERVLAGISATTPNIPDTASVKALVSLAEALIRAGDPDAAETAFHTALSLLPTPPGDFDELAIATLRALAILQLKTGTKDPAQPAQFLHRAVAASEILRGKAHPQTAELLGWEALALTKQGNLPAAADAAERAEQIARTSTAANESDPQIAACQALRLWAALFSANNSARQDEITHSLSINHAKQYDEPHPLISPPTPPALHQQLLEFIQTNCPLLLRPSLELWEAIQLLQSSPDAPSSTHSSGGGSLPQSVIKP